MVVQGMVRWMAIVGVGWLCAGCNPAAAPPDAGDPRSAWATATSSAGLSVGQLEAAAPARSGSGSSPPAARSLPTSPQACAELWLAGKMRLGAEAAKGPACKRDDECIGVPDHLCELASCGEVTHQENELAYGSAKAKIEAEVCGPFKSSPACASAPIPIPSCPPIKPACVNDRCTNKIGR